MTLTPWLAVLALAAAPGQAGQGTLVVRATSGARPVAGAEVRIADRTLRTGDRGEARCELAPGRWEVAIAAAGFHAARATAEVQADRETRVEVELAVAATREDEVVVTASRTDRRLEDQPVRIEVIDREDIEEKALMTPGSVAMLLGETTGLRVQTTAPALGAANVRIQGVRGRYSQLLSDGLPLYGIQGDSLSLLQVPPLDLGQVEIVKGAASALYGPSALGGVINLVSQQPRARHRELLVNQTTQAATDVAFWMVEPPRRSTGFTVLGGLHGQRARDLDGDGWADLPGYQRGVLRPRLFWDSGRGRTLFATAGIMAENRHGGTLEDATVPDGRPFRERLDSRRVDGGAVFKVPAGRNRVLTLRGSLARRGEDRLFGATRERGARTTWLGEAVLVGTAGRHTWLVGGALQQDGYAARDLPAFDYRFTTPGLLVQDKVSLARSLTLGASARLDRHSRYGTFASPRLSLLWKASDTVSTRLSAGTGFFAPTPFVEETEATGLARLLPPAGLRAERARSASLDTTWSRGPFEVVATLYGSTILDPLARRFVATERIELVNAHGPVRTWGSELLARYRREGFLVLATYEHTRSREDDPDAAARREVPLTPSDSASLNAIWERDTWGRFGVEAYYVGRQPLEDNPYRAAGRGYLLVGALFERRLGCIRLFVNAENLGNVRQTRHEALVRPVRARDGRWTVDAWAPLAGRVVNGGVRYIF